MISDVSDRRRFDANTDPITKLSQVSCQMGKS
jgi:hypothetical protein